ncbi:sulfite exporter TauE/SafE family protein [Pseudonocardia zijingensis]|uniref:Probable membrane transporter protein n=1 Tax=Pseudonocardia zijingensis TaxID=153376 RepID=A0ABN1N998_9PSEU
MSDMVAQSLVLVLAGVVAGAIGAAGGITSLVSYSALLAVGLAPLPATVTNLVAAVACGPGSVLTSRRELRATRPALLQALPIAVLAAGAGSVLLLITPPGVFSRIVPFLVALASLALLVQPWLSTLAARRPDGTRAVTWPLVGLVSLYAGYFGAGSGVMLLALLLVVIDDRLPEANAIKNVLLAVMAFVSAVVFAFGSPIDWIAAAPLALGLLVGSAIGPVIARYLHPRTVRWSVAALGSWLAIDLWLNHS